MFKFYNNRQKLYLKNQKIQFIWYPYSKEVYKMEEPKKTNNIGKILLVLILIIAATIGGWFIGYKGLIIKHPETKCTTEKEENKEQQPVEEQKEVPFAEGDIYNVEFFVSELNKAFADEESAFASYWIYDTVVATYDKEKSQIAVTLKYNQDGQTEYIDVKTYELEGKKYYSLVIEYNTVEGLDNMGLLLDFYGDLYAENMNKPLLLETIEDIPTAPPLFYEYVMQEPIKFETKEEFENYKPTRFDQPLYETYSYTSNGFINDKTRIIIPLHDVTYNALVR